MWLKRLIGRFFRWVAIKTGYGYEFTPRFEVVKSEVKFERLTVVKVLPSGAPLLIVQGILAKEILDGIGQYVRIDSQVFPQEYGLPQKTEYRATIYVAKP